MTSNNGIKGDDKKPPRLMPSEARKNVKWEDAVIDILDIVWIENGKSGGKG